MASSEHLESGMKTWILIFFHMILLHVNMIEIFTY
jgi:hypothetical protein